MRITSGVASTYTSPRRFTAELFEYASHTQPTIERFSYTS